MPEYQTLETYAWAPKAPGEVFEYTFDTAPAIPGDDSLTGVAWAVPAGVTEVKAEVNGKLAQIWLGGGTAGQVYDITATVTTLQGRTIVQTMRLPILTRKG